MLFEDKSWYGVGHPRRPALKGLTTTPRPPSWAAGAAGAVGAAAAAAAGAAHWAGPGWLLS